MTRERTEKEPDKGPGAVGGGRPPPNAPPIFLAPGPEPEARGVVKADTCHMTPGIDGVPGASRSGPGAGRVFTPEDEAHVRDALRRCSPSTREAAHEFRRTGNPACVPAIVDGLIEHFVDPDVRTKLSGSDDGLRLIEDLDIDSLTMLEIVYLAEDVLQITIDNAEIRPFRTVGDVKAFLAAKAERAYAPELTFSAGRPG
jgi:acyl carrier protein